MSNLKLILVFLRNPVQFLLFYIFYIIYREVAMIAFAEKYFPKASHDELRELLELTLKEYWLCVLAHYTIYFMPLRINSEYNRLE